MGAQRTSFAKLQRERAKKAKAAAKRERRLERDTDAGSGEERPTVGEGGDLTAAELLERVEQIHRQFAAKQISHEDFEEQKADLLARLPVD